MIVTQEQFLLQLIDINNNTSFANTRSIATVVDTYDTDYVESSASVVSNDSYENVFVFGYKKSLVEVPPSFSLTINSAEVVTYTDFLTKVLNILSPSVTVTNVLTGTQYTAILTVEDIDSQSFDPQSPGDVLVRISDTSFVFRGSFIVRYVA